MNSPRLLMTKGEFAAHRGVGKSAVSNYAAKDWLVMAECPTSGTMKVDVDRTEARLNAKLDPTRGRPKAADALPQGDLPLEAEAPRARAEPKGDSVAEVRSDLMRTQIVGNALKNARAAGELVAVADYARRASELGRLARERMQSLTRSLSERLAVETDPRQIVAILSVEIDAAFSDLADQVDAGALDEDAGAAEADVLAEVDAALAEGEVDEDAAEAG